MKINLTNSTFLSKPHAAYIILYTSINSLKKAITSPTLAPHIELLLSTKDICDNKQSIASCTVENQDKLSTCYFVNPGTEYNAMRHAAGTVIRHLKKRDITDIAVSFSSKPTPQTLQEFSEGCILGSYAYTVYKTDSALSTSYQPTLHVHTTQSSENNAAITNGIHIATAQNIARDLANTPANDLTPSDFVAFCHQHFDDTPVTVHCYTKEDAEEKGMGAFLAVAQGSVQPPYLLELTLNPSKKKPVILVGKGVTFDTGGISIKPSRSMSSMKGDMGGAAAVCGAMSGLVHLKCDTHVKALIPLVENMPSGQAYKPGDVITAMNGTTIEVINTDAEGRLILADTLCLATSYKPKAVIDIATLTGACSVALGDLASAILGSDADLLSRLESHQDSTGERVWKFPLYDDYKAYLKSTVADIMNCAENRLAGTATAAMFLKQFVQDTKWAHIDIASTMENKSTKGCFIKGMEGAGTRTLIACVLSYS